jgi:hypothetical protein
MKDWGGGGENKYSNKIYPQGEKKGKIIEADASLAKPVDSQWESNPFIKSATLKLDVLGLNGTNNSALKL